MNQAQRDYLLYAVVVTLRKSGPMTAAQLKASLDQQPKKPVEQFGPVELGWALGFLEKQGNIVFLQGRNKFEFLAA